MRNNYFKYFIEQSWLLIVSAFCFGVLIAIANAAWSPKIEQNRKDKLNRSMMIVVPGAATFERAIENYPVTAGNRKMSTDIYRAIDAQGKNVGWAFIAVGSGFADKIELVVGTDAQFKTLTGYDVLYTAETPGFGDKINTPYFKDQFQGAPTSGLELAKTGNPQITDNQIVAITGATVTSEAVVRAFNTYLKQARAALFAKGFIDVK